MKSAQLEILLFTDTHFLSKGLCEKYDTGNQNNSTTYKSLEAACWNGLFPEVLPELFMQVQNHQELILWRVNQAEHFLELEYGEQPESREKHFSMNPYFFMELQHLS